MGFLSFSGCSNELRSHVLERRKHVDPPESGHAELESPVSIISPRPGKIPEDASVLQMIIGKPESTAAPASHRGRP